MLRIVGIWAFSGANASVAYTCEITSVNVFNYRMKLPPFPSHTQTKIDFINDYTSK